MKTVLFSSSLKFRDIELELIKLIKNKKKISSVFLVDTQESKIFYLKKFPNLIDKILVLPNELELLKKKISYQEIYSQVLNIEKKYNTTIFKLFLSDRIIGRGFHASGGLNHPKTRLASLTNYKEILYLACERVKFWERLFIKYNVAYAINLPQSAAIIAKKQNIKYFNLNIAKFGKRLYWSTQPNAEPEKLFEEYQKNKNKNYNKVSISLPHHNHILLRNGIIKDFSFRNTLLKSIMIFPSSIRGRLKKYRKSTNILAISKFSYFWRRRKDFNFLKKITNINLKALEDKNISFIYFPLITEPEISLHGIASDFFFQLSAIQMLARDLPVNLRLVVKEHLPAVGRRPKDFYNQLIELKNVLIADTLEPGISYITKSKAVAIITGTAGWEAAAMGIPVISFSKYNSYNFLNHVFYVKDNNKIFTIYKKILKKNYPNTESESDGARMYFSYNALAIPAENRIPFVSWASAKDKFIDKRLILKIYNRLGI